MPDHILGLSSHLVTAASGCLGLEAQGFVWFLLLLVQPTIIYDKDHKQAAIDHVGEAFIGPYYTGEDYQTNPRRLRNTLLS
jgi:hypothetical protein